MRPSVYLAGAITGHSFDAATDWRDQAIQVFSAAGIDAYSPLRAKVYLQQETMMEDTYEEQVMSSQRGIFVRDHFDCRVRDGLFVNLLETTRVSIGTVMEIAWADAYRKPIVLVMEKTGNLHDHAMIREACPLWVHTLEEGYHVMKSLLLPVGHR